MSSTTGPASRGAASSSASRSRTAGAPYVDVALAREEGPGRRAGDDALPRGRDVKRPRSRRRSCATGRQSSADAEHPALSSVRASASRRATRRGRISTHRLQLTIADLVVEAHDTHHPLATALLRGPEEGGQARAEGIPFPAHPEILRLLRARDRATTPAGKSARRRRRPHHRRLVAVPGMGGPGSPPSHGRLPGPTGFTRRSPRSRHRPRRARMSPPNWSPTGVFPSTKFRAFFRHYPQLDAGPSKAGRRKSWTRLRPR